MWIRVDAQKIEKELEVIKLDAPQFFRRCLERVFTNIKPHIGARLTQTFKDIKKKSKKNYHEERELVYELFLISSSSEEEIIYLYYITLAQDPIQEFIESQNLQMNSIARLVAKEISNV